MNISALSNINFKSNTPVYHVYNINKDGSKTELNREQITGPVLALVRRLNQNYTSEADFFAKHIPDFKFLNKATSTVIGANDIRKHTIVYGRDALNIQELRNDCYVKDCYSDEYINSAIKNLYIRPLDKSTIYSKTREPIGLVLYTKSIGKNYKLFGVNLVTATGHIIAKLINDNNISEQAKQSLIEPKTNSLTAAEEEVYTIADEDAEAYNDYLAEMAEKNKEEYPPRPEELEEEFEEDECDDDAYINLNSNPNLNSKPQKFVQGELFDWNI